MTVSPEPQGTTIVTLTADSDPSRPLPLSWVEYEAAVMGEWRALLDSNPEEDEVQRFLELHPAMVPGAAATSAPVVTIGRTRARCSLVRC